MRKASTRSVFLERRQGGLQGGVRCPTIAPCEGVLHEAVRVEREVPIPHCNEHEEAAEGKGSGVMEYTEGSTNTRNGGEGDSRLKALFVARSWAV